MAELQSSTGKNRGLVWSDRKHHMWFPIGMTKYSVENERLYVNSGLFSSREDECLLYRILDISMTRNFLQMLFGTGTIELNTKDRSTPVIRLINIKNPKEVKRLLSDLIEQDRMEKRVEGKDMYGASNHYDHMEEHEFEGDCEDC